MSLILEALQKSESERNLGQVPGLDAAVVQQTQHAAQRWKFVALAVIGLNVIAAIGYLVGQHVLSNHELEPLDLAAAPPPEKLDGSAGSQQTAVVGAAPDAPPILDDIDAVRRYEQTRLPATPVRPAMVANNSPQGMAGKASAAATAPAPAAVETPLDVAAVETPQESLPSIDQVRNGVLPSLAPLRLDVHVYSEKTDERFVFINMKKYHEGEEIREGPRVASIETSGVVLEYQGQKFVLTAQQ